MMEKEFERTHRGVNIWYDKGSNLWRSESVLSARHKEDLEAMIDRDLDKNEPIPCIMVDTRPSFIEFRKILETFDNGNLKIETLNGDGTTVSPNKFYKDTPENRAILEKIMKNGEKMNKLMLGLEKI